MSLIDGTHTITKKNNKNGKKINIIQKKQNEQPNITENVEK